MATKDRDVPFYRVKNTATVPVSFDFTELFPSGSVLTVASVDIADEEVVEVNEANAIVAGPVVIIGIEAKALGESLVRLWVTTEAGHRDSLECVISVEE